jgi:hypothetical protein
MIRGKQKTQNVVSSSPKKKKKPPKTNLKILSNIYIVPMRNKMKGGIEVIGNYNLENTQYSKINGFSTKENTQYSKINGLLTKESTPSEQYSYNMPPENLTYEKLLKIFSGDLQNGWDFDLEKNAKEIAEEISEKIINIEGEKKDFANYNINIVNSVFTQIIENKIENKIKNKELLRKKLWNILYTAHYGYASKYIEKYGDKYDEITIGEAIKSEMINDKSKSIGGKYNLNGGSSPPPLLPPPLPPPLPQHLSNIKFLYATSTIKLVWNEVWNYVFKILTNSSLEESKSESKSKSKSESESESKSDKLIATASPLIYPPLIYNHLEIEKELPEIKRQIISSLTSYEDIDKINSDFNLVDLCIGSKTITRSIFLRREIENKKKFFKNKKEQAASIYTNYSMNSIDKTIYKPFKDLYIYGMDNPNQYNRANLLSSMLFLLENIKITDFIDLQDCEGGTYKIGEIPIMDCNPYDRGAEREMFDLATEVLVTKNIIDKKTKREYKNIKDIVDMTAGSFLAWKQINDLPVASSTNRMVIHCFAGKGRTGTTLLFLRLRDINDMNIETRLTQEHLGYENINDLIKNLKELFRPKEEDEDNLHKYYWEEVIKEVFKIDEFWHVKLLRQRLNRIFYFLAKTYNVKTFYLYSIPFKEKFGKFDYRFKSYFEKPYEVTINWRDFDHESLKRQQYYVDGMP